METFYRTKNNSLVKVVDEALAIYYDNFSILTTSKDVDFIVKNMELLSPEDIVVASAIFESIKDFVIVEEIDWVRFIFNKATYKTSAIFWEQIFDLDSPDIKISLLKEKKKMKDFLKWIRTSKETFMLWDRILMYWPTWTWKTYNFIEFLKVAKIDYSIIPVTEWMEDIDMFNRIVPWATWVSYMQKEICKLFEKAEKWEKICIIFDELNRWSNSFMNLVLKALDPVDWKNYYITDVIQDRTYIIPQENIIWWATVNLWGKYTGTNSLDEALLDRFNIIKYKGYDLTVEKWLIENVVTNKDNVKQIQDFVKEIREYHKAWEIRAPISTRWVKVWLEDFFNTWNLLESFEKTILYRLVSVDDYWNPNQEELAIISQKFKEVIK